MQLIGFYLLSKNIPAMVDFYTKVLRAEATGEGNHIVINLPGGKGGFPIWDNGEVSDVINERAVLWFSVDNVDDEYNILLNMNARILEPPANTPWGARAMVFCDPDGNRVSFITPN
ncbi:MAG: VOC family protein [Clostridiales bacterium]|jgi:predicted enzyme related to lactoylglutathione lyase|nr:VOC family protein [Clostridiales bacterium]